MSSSRGRAFSTVDRPDPLYLTVAAQITAEIASGRLAPGDRLPSEHEMAGAFHVSRNVVREAIACLRADGVIESRQGLGAFVLDPKERQVIRIHPNSLEDAHKQRSLFEFRGLLEIEAAGLAATRRTRQQLEGIASALAQMEGEGRLTAMGVDADIEFHRRIAEASGNEYLVEFLNFVGLKIRQTIFAARTGRDIEVIVTATIAEHRAICEAIAAADPDAARRAMQHHIQSAAGRLLTP